MIFIQFRTNVALKNIFTIRENKTHSHHNRSYPNKFYLGGQVPRNDHITSSLVCCREARTT